MTLSNYEMTAQINNLVGNVPTPDDLAALNRQLTLIDHEIEEGEESFRNSDIAALRDDVCDILFTAYGLGHRMGLEKHEMSFGQSQATNWESAHSVVRIFHDATAALEDEFLAKSLVGKTLETIRSRFRSVESLLNDPQVPDAVAVDQLKFLIFSTYVLGAICGFPVDADYRAVVESNMSKFDTSREDAEKTQAKYAALGVETIVVEGVLVEGNQAKTYYITKSAKDQVDQKGVKYPAGKYLKSHQWVEPQYRPLDVDVSAA